MRTVGQALESHDPAIVNTVLSVIQERVGCDDKALAMYLELSEWTFKLNNKAHNRFGVCKIGKATIEVHAALVDHPFDYGMTLIHEVAHALDYLLHGDTDGHGGRWVRLMIDLGQKPLRVGGHTEEAHAAVVAMKVQTAKEMWTCSKCGYDVPIARKRKYPANRYTHSGGCGGTFTVKE